MLFNEMLFPPAGFVIPVQIDTTPSSILWLLPLVAFIALVYKAIKLPQITLRSLSREVTILFGTIIIFMILIAAALYAFLWLITE